MITNASSFQLTTHFSDLHPENLSYAGDKALILVEACRLCQEPDSSIQQQLTTAWSFPSTTFKFIDQGVVQAFIVANEQVILLCFRGSDSREDWQANLNFPKDPVAIGQVHQGWWRALDKVWTAIEDHIKTVRTPENPQSIWVTGHSLGGALATLATFRLGQAGLPLSGLYTFGQPRVGNRRFGQAFDLQFKQRSFRFANNNDGVTIVPPALFNYVHIGNFLYFTHAGELRKTPTVAYTTWDFSRGLLAGIGRQGIEIANDHSIGAYMQLIRKNFADNPFA
ncbi:MAG: lipase family protein [Cyanothece sp. SIO1E1]|nr:lipase family protein [Cyanothece sp. SIO1E1]